MKLTISSSGIRGSGSSVEEALTLLTIANGVDIQNERNNLVKKGYAIRIVRGNDISYNLTNEGINLINKICLESEKDESQEDEFTKTASEIKSTYPKGMKVVGRYGSTMKYPWTESVPLIVIRLKTFFKKYGQFIKDTYPDFEMSWITDAVKLYVDENESDRTYMKTLKYFIFEEKIGAGGDRESGTGLLNYLDTVSKKRNGIEEEDEVETSSGWMNEIR